jgi:hypothetical protein
LFFAISLFIMIAAVLWGCCQKIKISTINF